MTDEVKAHLKDKDGNVVHEVEGTALTGASSCQVQRQVLRVQARVQGADKCRLVFIEEDVVEVI